MSSKNKSGFSIIETIVAIALLMLVLTGATSLVNLSLRTITTFRDELTATMLAQEGAEYIRWKRDSNRIASSNPNNWMDNILVKGSAPCNGSACIAQLSTATGNVTFSKCTGGPCPPLRFNSTTGIFSYEMSGTMVTPFIRTIEVTEITTHKEVRVRSTVTWPRRFGVGVKSVVVEEILLNWQ